MFYNNDYKKSKIRDENDCAFSVLFRILMGNLRLSAPSADSIRSLLVGPINSTPQLMNYWV